MEMAAEDQSKFKSIVEAELHHMDWTTLRLLNNYRAFLLVAIAAVVYFSDVNVSIGSADPILFSVAMFAYVVVAGFFAVSISLRTPDIATQFYVQSYVDIGMLCILMYCSGGVQSGLSMLLVISIAILSHCSAPRYSLLFAAMSSVMILTQEMFTAHAQGYSEASFTQAAVAGATLFVTGYLISVVLPVKQKEVMRTQFTEIQNLTNTNSIITSDLRLAASLQASLLPEPARFGNTNVAGFCNPALYVGGDIFDYFLINPRTLVIYMADVVGHGAASAMISYAVHNQLHPRTDGMCVQNFGVAADSTEFVKMTLQQLNASFADSRDGDRYFTLHFSVLDLETGELAYSQAGHPLPILHRKAEGTVQEIGDGGLPIGIFKDAEIDVYHLKLSPNDSFVVYSDGATECFSPEEKQFGVDRLMDKVNESSGMSDESFQTSLIKSLKDWQQSDDFSDDVSILRLRFG